MTVTVVLADDEGLIRTALATLLPLEGDIDVVAEAADGEAAYAAFVEHRPDVLVLDFEMPVLDGLEVAARVLAEHPEQRILMLTRHARPGTLRRALAWGFEGSSASTRRPTSSRRPSLRCTRAAGTSTLRSRPRHSSTTAR
ncbi:DNA-binding response regulator [Demequina litorisediminis]|uniref:DNA-binding response regulator n=1 Tax=Demequina litorisediminis TaxID=1849022 RepID=A0ABQ6IHP8_9MICO|nr:DNA-binding response regulator [Demequina litorisediminis]